LALANLSVGKDLLDARRNTMKATDRDQRLVFGYLWAVASATMVLFVFVLALTRTVWKIDLDSPLTFLGSAALAIAVLVLIWLLIFFCILVLAIVPFSISFVIAERFSIQNAWYYILSGGLTGLILAPVFGKTGQHLSTAFYERYVANIYQLPLYERYFTVTDARLLVLSGAFAGFVYWWKAGNSAGILQGKIER
jgi:hypothetical protein